MENQQKIIIHLIKSFVLLILFVTFWYMVIFGIHYCYVKGANPIDKIIKWVDRGEIIWSGWLIEAFILFFLYILGLAVSLRPKFSMILVILAYLIFQAATLASIYVLGVPLLPRDIAIAGDLLVTREWMEILLPPALIILIVSAFILYWFFKKTNPSRFVRRVRLHLGAGVIIFSVILINMIHLYSDNFNALLSKNNLKYKQNSEDPIKQGVRKGFLESFFQILVLKPEPPEKYSKRNIESIISKYNMLRNDGDVPKVSDRAANLILLFIESFTDPVREGWKLSINPIPNFSRICALNSCGTVYSPVVGGKSVSAEFEAVTGLSKRFLPPGGNPYREDLLRQVPSISGYLKKYGYHASVIQVVKMSTFGFGRVYRDFLDFDHLISLAGVEASKLDVMKRYASEKTIVEEIISITEKNSSPVYVQAFANSTHSPWNPDYYPEPRVKVLEKGLSPHQQKTLEGYVNALREADKAIGMLIEYFERSREPTVIVILGDHQPGINFYRDRKYERLLQQGYPRNVARYIADHGLSMVVWSNKERKRETFAISLNFLPSLMLERLNIQPDGFMRFNDIARRKIGVLSWMIRDGEGNLRKRVPSEFREIVQDYKLLQYDILSGANYYAEVACHYHQSCRSQKLLAEMNRSIQ